MNKYSFSQYIDKYTLFLFIVPYAFILSQNWKIRRRETIIKIDLIKT